MDKALEAKEFKILAVYASDGVEIELEYSEWNIQGVRQAYGNGVFAKYSVVKKKEK
jgi:hypothetical protein